MIDPRGQRFAASLTAVVLAAVLLLDSPALLGLQAVVFAVGAFAGPAATPYALVFRKVIRPFVGPPTELEHVEPPKFAQLVGLGFALTGLVGYIVGLPVLAWVAVAAALAASFLNAAFGFCLGCEVYLWLQRSRVAWRPVGETPGAVTNRAPSTSAASTQ